MTNVEYNTTEELLDLLSRDSRPAFEEIYNRYWASLFNTAYKRLKNAEQCKDLIQDLFADLWIKRKTIQIENLSAYLHTAVRYQVIKLASRNKVVPTFYELYDSIATSPFFADSDLVHKELEELAQSWLDSLPEKRKEILLLRFRDNLSTNEIANLLQISQKTVQNQLGIAYRGFRDQIGDFSVFLLCLPLILK